VNKIKQTSLIVALAVVSSNLLASPTVYIPLGSANQVIAVDAANDKITTTYTGVGNPHGLVATPDGEHLIAGSLQETPLKSDQAKDSANSNLFLIHPAHGHVMANIPVSGWTHHQAMSPDGRYVLSTHGGRGYVSVMDMEKNEVVRTIATGPGPNYTLITKDSKYAYVSNSANNTISEIDLGSWKVMRTLESGPAPEHMVFSSDESMIHVTNPRAGKISTVSLLTGRVEASYSAGQSVHGLDLGDDGKTLYVSSKKEDKLTAIDTKTGVKRELSLSPAPYHLNTISGTGKVYVTSRVQPIIWVVDQETMKVTNTINLPGGEGHQMAIVN